MTPKTACEAPKDGWADHPLPGSAESSGEKQHGGEVDDGGRGEGFARVGFALAHGQVGDEGHGDELQAGEGAGGGAGDLV